MQDEMDVRPTFKPYRRPFSDNERDTILFMLLDNRPRAEIAAAIDRSVGSIGGEIARLRRSGLATTYQRGPYRPRFSGHA